MSEEHESQKPVADPCEGTPERLKDYKIPDYDMIDPEEDIERWPNARWHFISGRTFPRSKPRSTSGT